MTAQTANLEEHPAHRPASARGKCSKESEQYPIQSLASSAILKTDG